MVMPGYNSAQTPAMAERAKREYEQQHWQNQAQQAPGTTVSADVGAGLAAPSPRPTTAMEAVIEQLSRLLVANRDIEFTTRMLAVRLSGATPPIPEGEVVPQPDGILSHLDVLIREIAETQGRTCNFLAQLSALI